MQYMNIFVFTPQQQIISVFISNHQIAFDCATFSHRCWKVKYSFIFQQYLILPKYFTKVLVLNFRYLAEPDQLTLIIKSDRDLNAYSVVTNNNTSTWHHQFIETILAGCQKGKTNIFKSIKSIYYPYELIRRQSVACVLSKNSEENKNILLCFVNTMSQSRKTISVVRKYLLTAMTHNRF